MLDQDREHLICKFVQQCVSIVMLTNQFPRLAHSSDKTRYMFNSYFIFNSLFVECFADLSHLTIFHAKH